MLKPPKIGGLLNSFDVFVDAGGESEGDGCAMPSLLNSFDVFVDAGGMIYRTKKTDRVISARMRKRIIRIDDRFIIDLPFISFLTFAKPCRYYTVNSLGHEAARTSRSSLGRLG